MKNNSTRPASFPLLRKTRTLSFMIAVALFFCLTSPALFGQDTGLPKAQTLKYRQEHSYNKTAIMKRKNVARLSGPAPLLSVKAADSVTNPLSQLIQSLVGPGVTVSNIQTTLPKTSDIYGSFSGGTSVIGMESGLIMTSGSVFNALGPNISPSTSQDNGLPGYLQIDTAGFDAAVISFDVTSSTSFLSFRYVFASEEYNEFVGSQFNDDFAFLISGPGIPPGTNIALIPGTNHPVDINDVNLSANAQYYINNDSVQNADPVRFQNLEYDGLTKVLTTASVSVIPGATYTITLVIQDVSDAIYDSGVFIEGGSITSDSCVLHLSVEKKDITCHGADNGSIDLTVTGFNGSLHYAWTNGDTTQDLDHLPPGLYNVTVTDDKGCVKSLPSSIEIIEPAAIVLDSPIITGASCGVGNNGSATLGASGGTPPYQFAVDTVINNTGIFTGLAAGTYEYFVTDSNGCTAAGIFIIPQASDITCSINIFPDPTVPGQAKHTIFLGYGPQTVLLKGNIKNGNTGPYKWDWGIAGKGRIICVKPSVTTNYTLTVTDKNGCQSSCSITINVVDARCGSKLEKVLVCHKAKNTICISPFAVPAHLLHGDRLGTCSTTATNTEAATGLSSPSAFEDLTIKVMPNPSTGYFAVEIGSVNVADRIVLRILDLDGRPIEVRNNLRPGQKLSIGFDYKPGIYVAEVVQGNRRVTAKLIKY